MSIKILRPEVIAGISAGEVVERPASVVKELVENALDAGASRIRVEILSAGMKMIRVADDGEGMSASDAVAAFERHATSKLEKLNDLERLGTYGFRGEALAAIAAAGEVELRTRTSNSNEGTLVTAGPGRKPRVKPAGCEKGTDIVVSALFESVPARLKFLRSPSAETTSIVRAVEPYVLSRPEIHFQLLVDGEERINAPPSSDASKRLQAVLGSPASEMISFSGKKGGMGSSGFVQLPGTINRRGKAWFLVNGRPIEDRSLRHALASAYGSEMPRGAFPAAVIHISVPASRIDVNVHPAKTEIRFADPQEAYRLLLSSIRNAFQSAAPRAISGEPPQHYDSPPKSQTAAQELFVSEPAVLGEFKRPETAVAESSGGRVEILGQYLGTYILAKFGDSILLVDQHAAHEKILYERMSGQTGASASQNLLVPRTIDLKASEASVVERFREPLAKAGFDFDSFGGNSFVLRAIPAGISDGDAETLFVDLIEAISETGRPVAGEATLHDIRSTVACHSAIRAGDRMGLREMEALTLELLSLENPHSCPHGRPTYLRLDRQYLAGVFRRSLDRGE